MTIQLFGYKHNAHIAAIADKKVFETPRPALKKKESETPIKCKASL